MAKTYWMTETIKGEEDYGEEYYPDEINEAIEGIKNLCSDDE